MQIKINSIGYPFQRSNSGMFNPINNKQQNARSKLLNLLSTNKGQRILSNNCQFGINLQRFLFQSSGDPSNSLQKQIKKWIPQINQVKTQVQKDKNTFTINIKFKVDQEWDSIFLEMNAGG